MFSTVKSYLNENICPINKQQNESEHPLESKQTDKNLNKIRKSIGRKGLLICSLNAPSLVKHKNEIEVSVVENKIDIIAINETKLESILIIRGSLLMTFHCYDATEIDKWVE